MRVYWWQGGLHIEPESDKEVDMLVGVVESVRFMTIEQAVQESNAKAVIANSVVESQEGVEFTLAQ